MRRRAALVYRFNLGGPDYTDVAGQPWTGYTNGHAFDYQAGGYISPAGILNTLDDTLYVTVLLSDAPFTLPVPAGTYSIVAHYAEDFNDTGGKRSSGLRDAQGNVLIADFDVFTAAGGRQVAYWVAAASTVTVPGGGGLTLKLPTVSNNGAVICAIELTKLS